MLDIRCSNLQSVARAFDRIGAPVEVSDRPADVERAELVVLPGVGAFNDGMESLRSLGLEPALVRHVRVHGRPLLGICLGMQLLAEHGEEGGPSAGLGFIPGRVVRLQPDKPGLRVPNMGWCDVDGIGGGRSFYFAHSYYLDCSDPSEVTGTFRYGSRRIAAAVRRGGVWGVQFHPEKSQDAGLQVLEAVMGVRA